jgi:hypothetical protein
MCEYLKIFTVFVLCKALSVIQECAPHEAKAHYIQNIQELSMDNVIFSWRIGSFEVFLAEKERDFWLNSNTARKGGPGSVPVGGMHRLSRAGAY